MREQERKQHDAEQAARHPKGSSMILPISSVAKSTHAVAVTTVGTRSGEVSFTRANGSESVNSEKNLRAVVCSITPPRPATRIKERPGAAQRRVAPGGVAGVGERERRAAQLLALADNQ
jgi:hypothetical protein